MGDHLGPKQSDRYKGVVYLWQLSLTENLLYMDTYIYIIWSYIINEKAETWVWVRMDFYSVNRDCQRASLTLTRKPNIGEWSGCGGACLERFYCIYYIVCYRDYGHKDQ